MTKFNLYDYASTTTVEFSLCFNTHVSSLQNEELRLHLMQVLPYIKSSFDFDFEAASMQPELGVYDILVNGSAKPAPTEEPSRKGNFSASKSISVDVLVKPERTKLSASKRTTLTMARG